jgi:hypothetical protein
MVSPQDRTSASDRIKPEPAPSAALREAFEQFAEVRDYLLFYLRTRIDRLKLSVRNLFCVAAVAIVVLLLGAALLVTAVVLLCRGIAEGLTVLFDGRAWLGDVVTAVVLLVAVVGGIYGTLNHITGTWKERTVHAYERQKRQQRAAHGTDVDERANQ